MSEEVKETTKQEPAAKEEQDKNEVEKITRLAKENPIEFFSKGKLRLNVPIRSNDQDVEVLEYDFRALGGLEFARCMDRGNSSTRNNTYNVTDEQALNLFAAAVEKKMENVDAADVRRGLSIEDTVKAVQIATSFFVVCTQEGNKRIMNASYR